MHDPVIIPMMTWTQYFSDLFYDESKISDPSPETSLVDLPRWPSVTSEEVKELILSLKSGKAAGADGIPAELLKSDLDWWARLLAHIFTTINNSCLIPRDWLISIIVPIHKKGDPSSPANFRPVSLLSVLGKTYGKYLCNKLTSWIIQQDILGPEQSGFRQGKSTLDNCLILSHLAYKQTRLQRARLYVAFLDLKGAFDSVDRDILWSKLEHMGIDKRLLALIRALHLNTTCRIRSSWAGTLSGSIPSNKGVKQGCVLAPTLFNLFLNDFASALEEVDGHSPKLDTTHVPLLLYADDAVLLSRSRVGLRRLLSRAVGYFSSNKLQINYSKSKIMVFANRWKAFNWSCNGNTLEQVKQFKYLGVNFHYKCTWACHRKTILNTSKLSSAAISRFFFTVGNGFVPAALEAFKGKVIAQALYGSPVWLKAFNRTLESLQYSFLRKILGVPGCVPYAVLCLETGSYRLKTIAWLRTVKYWFRILFNPTGLMFHLCSDSVIPLEISELLNKLKLIGLSPSELGMIDREAAYRMVRVRTLDIEQQELLCDARSTCSPLQFHISLSAGKPAFFLHHLLCPHTRRAFTLARSNALPSALLLGRFHNIPYSERFCSCNGISIETLSHTVFYCQHYNALRNKHLGLFLSRMRGWNESVTIQLMLSTHNIEFLNSVAAFFLGVVLDSARHNRSSIGS